MDVADTRLVLSLVEIGIFCCYRFAALLDLQSFPTRRSSDLGHKAASDVRDEFVSVTEKLMDELAQCYNVLPQLDINNTIDHRPEGDEKWFLENEKTVTQFCRKLAAERPLKDIRDE